MQQRLGCTAVLVFAAALLPAAPARAQAITTYVAFGDSLTAGFSNGSLVETHQSLSYPALLARQAGVSAFEEPLISQPGIPAELTLVTLIPPVAANIPDVMTIPFVNTIRPVVVSPTTGAPVLVNGQTVPLLGPNGPLPANSLVTLAASPLLLKGDGIPTALGGTGRGLPDEVILDLNEVAVIRERVGQYNQVIATICQAAGIPVLDINAFFTDVAVNGRMVGGVSLTSAYLSGGLF